MNDDLFSTRWALLSVFDKTGIVELGQFLIAQGLRILSTGGTAALLREHGVVVTEISDYTGFPEAMDGRLKTLHPRVHGGLLGRLAQDREVMVAQRIAPIDLLVVNLYPFEQTIQKAGVTFEQAIENIDVGGPAMIRAAAKNHQRTAVVVDPADYNALREEMRRHDGASSASLRAELAAKAFERTAAYDAAIAHWLKRASDVAPDEDWPARLELSLSRVSTLRYGENPHQRGAFYTHRGGGLAGTEQLLGKSLSYNNVADVSVACECVGGFEVPACVIVKHANPCAVACAASPGEAYERALAADPVSAFGGIVAFNRTLDAAAAREILARQFVEVVIAPQVAAAALEVLSEKKALRVLACSVSGGGVEYRSVLGGLLAQDRDDGAVSADDLTVRSKRRPDDNEIGDLLFAWRVVKFVRSNAIVFAHDVATAGIGAGQANRVGSVKIAAEQARTFGATDQPLVMASDAFFPFRDGIDAAAEAGVTAVIQPGGSIHDDAVVAAADERDLAMVFTGMRHFRH